MALGAEDSARRCLMSVPRNHHFLPQMFLERFAWKKGKLRAIDLEEKREFFSRPRNLCAKQDFYRLDNASAPFAIENFYGKIEGNAKAAMDTMEDGTGENADISPILDFMAAQATRDPHVRDTIESAYEDLAKKITAAALGTREEFTQIKKGLAAQSAEFDDLDYDELKEAELEWESGKLRFEPDRNWVIPMIVRQAAGIRPHLARRNWSLVTVPDSSPLLSSDRPVALNMKTTIAGMSPGFGTPNSIVAMPLSSKSVIVGTFPGEEIDLSNASEVAGRSNAVQISNAERFLFLPATQPFSFSLTP